MSTQHTIYNATDGPLIIDRAGHVLGAREHSPDLVDVAESPVSGHIADGRIIVPAHHATEETAQEDTAAPAPAKRGGRTSTPTQEA